MRFTLTTIVIAAGLAAAALGDCPNDEPLRTMSGLVYCPEYNELEGCCDTYQDL